MTDGEQTQAPILPAGLDRGQSFLAAGGVVLIYGAVAIFGLICFKLFQDQGRPPRVEYFIPELMMAVVGTFAALLGVRVVRSVGLAKNQQPNRVINKDEWDTICEKVKEGSEDAVSQYIRLTSLTGFTGTFTKLGLTGLPLATIALTIFFSALSLSYAETFLDLAKLTLGAFIGSFVQKQVGASQAASVKLPTGETLRVQHPSETPF